MVRAVAFLLGTVAIHSLSELPPPYCLAALTPAAAALLCRGRLAAALGGVAAGAAWALWSVLPAPQLQLPANAAGIDLQVDGWLASLPQTVGRRTRFWFAVDTLRGEHGRVAFAGRLLLSWYDDAPPLRVGDRWRLTVRLRRPRGPRNPGGFDVERWLLSNGLHATGYVRTEPPPQRLKTERFAVDRYRQALSERLSARLGATPEAALLAALTVGDRRAVSDDQRRVLRATGTAHLLAISGLHIGLVAGLVATGGGRLWRRSAALCRRLAATHAAALMALSAATGYALLAGLSLPTQRALVMLAVVVAARCARRPLAPGTALALALIAVLLLDPLAPLSAGFWLSFLAVAALLYLLVGRYAGPADKRSGMTLGRWAWLQLGLLIALAPVTLSQAGLGLAAASLPANLIAIPWVGVAVVPLALAGVLADAVSAGLADICWRLAALALAWLWGFLAWLANCQALPLIERSAPLWTLLPAAAGVALLLAPRGLPGRWLGVPLCLPLVLASPAGPDAGAARVTVLDVGQGVAAVLRTEHKTLVYDTGPPRRSVLVPFLRAEGIRRVDRLVISRAAASHSGAAAALSAALSVGEVFTADPLRVPINGADRCRAGVKWRWDGVQLQLLDAEYCTLLVTTGGGRLLLAPSLTPAGASRLLRRTAAPDSLRAETLLAPPGKPLPAAFVAAVRPRRVVFSTGYRNRYGQPRPAVVAAYRAVGAEVINTARSGAVTLSLSAAADTSAAPVAFRQAARRHWHTP